MNYLQELAAQFANPVTAIAQILGFIPVILGYFIFHYNNRIVSITIKGIADFISAVHFLMLGQVTGCAINCVNTFRGICFAQKGHYQWASGVHMPIIFCLFTVASSLVGWNGLISLFPMLGSCLAVIGYWCKDPSHLRRFNFGGIFLWLIYGILTFSVPTMVGNVISLFSIIATEVRINKEKSV